jgi:hypothetical protein
MSSVPCIDVEIERADGAGAVGVALLYDSAERNYQLRVLGAIVEHVRVADGAEDVLAATSLASMPGPLAPGTATPTC